MTSEFASPAEVMQRALELARRGAGAVEPNPMVGAVVVDERLTLLGEGWHERFGGPHAEVNAIRAAGDRCRGAQLYVTLEPCSHHGKTPPCAEAVLAAGFRKVVVAIRDPAPHVDGRGIELLRQAGIEVEVGLLEPQALRLTAPFRMLMLQGRPWVHAKWAMTLDGRIATRTGHSQWITSDASRARGHQLRGRMDAIIAGVGTVLTDDPLLTARPQGLRTATRIVLDSRGRTPLDSKLLQTAGDAPVLLAVTSAATPEWRDAALDRGAEIFELPMATDARGVHVTALVQELGRRKLTNVLLEGGGRVLGSFFDAGCVDECHAFIAPKIVGGALAPGPVGGIGLEQIGPSLHESSVELIGADVYVHGFVRGA